MAKPQFKSIQELRGRYIGIVRFGDTIELATKIAFTREGMDAQRDAVLIMIGLPSTRVAALAAGSVDATIAIPPDNVLLSKKAFASCCSWAMPSSSRATALLPPSASSVKGANSPNACCADSIGD